ncbi:uncharacterized protein PEZ65_014826 isoform 2-T2 [Lycodopsis pacificus]
MYNGIGLTTPRGSGTNGYVQRNLSSLRVKRPRDERGGERDEKDRERLESQLNRQPNADILEHQRKRQLEVKCAELQDMMEEQGYSAEEIEEKVNTFRMMLQEKEEPAPVTSDRPTATETHALAAANQQKNDRLRAAFGISSDYVDGSSFHADRKEKEKEKKEQDRLERERQQKYTLVEDSDHSDSPPKKRSRKKKKKNKNRDSSESQSPSPRREKKKSKKKKKKREMSEEEEEDRSVFLNHIRLSSSATSRALLLCSPSGTVHTERDFKLSLQTCCYKCFLNIVFIGESPNLLLLYI